VVAFPALLGIPGLLGVPGLRHAVTTRAGGVSSAAWSSLNLGRSSGDDPANVAENRARVTAALGFERLVVARQVHGRGVVDLADLEAEPPEGDAILAGEPGGLVGVLGADCPVLLLVDPEARALAVVHSGWRGTVAGVAPAALAALASRYGANPERVLVGLGPAIGPARYEVGPEVVDAVADAIPGASACVLPGPRGRCRLDLLGLIARQVEAAGVRPENVSALGACTFEEEARFFSHRRDGARTGRHALVAGWSA
jgi:YfiH family protein